MEDLYAIRPTYSDGVKITDWHLRLQASPFDFRSSPKLAHYRTLGYDDKFYFLKTTTQEALENGISAKKSAVQSIYKLPRTQRRPMANFTSFPSLDTPERFASAEKPKTECSALRSKSNAQIHMTTYKRSYVDHRPRPIKEREAIPDIQDLYPLVNRISKNDFEMVCALSPNKFMDDHLINPTPQKKLSNYYKQIRMVTYNPWLGTFR